MSCVIEGYFDVEEILNRQLQYQIFFFFQLVMFWITKALLKIVGG